MTSTDVGALCLQHLGVCLFLPQRFKSESILSVSIKVPGVDTGEPMCPSPMEAGVVRIYFRERRLPKPYSRRDEFIRERTGAFGRFDVLPV